MTFNQIQLDLNRRLNYQDTPATAVTNRLNAFLNQRHRQLLSMPGINRLRDDRLTFASVASQATYAMGPALSRINTITDATTNQITLKARTLDWIRDTDPGLTTTGTPEIWAPISWKQVQVQPAAACDLHVISTSASDGAGTTCYVEYTRTGGYRGSTSHALNGTTDVALTSTTDVIEVDKFYVSVAAVGTIKLLDGLAGNTLATIAVGQTYGRYQWIQLWPTPSAAVTYSVDYTREIADMSIATDEPLLPPDFHYLLSVGARIDEYEKMADPRIAIVRSEWDRGVLRLRDYVLNTSDYVIVPRGMDQIGISNLGGSYPAGTW